MLHVYTRQYRYFILDRDSHRPVIDWKLAGKVDPYKLPNDLFYCLRKALQAYFRGFDMVTVPAPSFHGYDYYPAWVLADAIASTVDIPLVKLFPNKSGKTSKGVFASLNKDVQDIQCPPGKFVLVLDDILTTGHTMRVTCEAILRKGSFPCGLTIA